MGDMTFPSGPWTGFYTHSDRNSRYFMDLILQFRNGTIRGEGSDGVGRFAIDGHYDPKQGECGWIKTYVGRHSVEYIGYREKKGIWGTWTLTSVKGGFHIWPIGEGTPAEDLKKEVEVELPLKKKEKRRLAGATGG